MEFIKTRWAYAYYSVERTIRLKSALVALAQDDQSLMELLPTEVQWVLLDAIIELWKPFMEAITLLEGESYVTISLLPGIIYKLRMHLEQAAALPEAHHHDQNQKRLLALLLLRNFKTHWGAGTLGTAFLEHTTEGLRRRHKGIPYGAWIASFLDPRTKSLQGLGLGVKENAPDQGRDDTDLLRAEVKLLMLEDVRADPVPVAAAAAAAPVLAAAAAAPVPAPVLPAPLHAGGGAARGPPGAFFFGGGGAAPAPPPRVDRVGAIDRELAAFATEPQLDMFEYDGATQEWNYSDALAWWKDKAKIYPRLARLSRKYLATPASSAPSERVFSRAGITIAKDRASLLPENAGQLVFLHLALPKVEEWRRRRGLGDIWDGI